MRFVNLHVHSHYSLLDGLSRIEDLVRLAKEYEMPALALTDHGALYGAIEFYQKCRKEGIRPIIGVETYITSRGRFLKRSKEDDERFHLILLAQTTQGYKNLIKLVTAAHLEGYYYRPRIDFELLEKYSEGIIASSACINGQLGNAILHGGDCSAILQRYLDIFGDRFYLELQHHPNLTEQQIVNDGLLKLAQQYHVPLIATGDSHYTYSEDSETHDILLCLQTKKQKADKDRLCMLGEDFSFHNCQHIIDAFSSSAPSALENTVLIAQRCDVEIEMGRTILPHVELPDGKTDEDRLKEFCVEGVKRRYGDQPRKDVEERLTYELGVIIKAGFASYFLIVQDFVNWAKSQGIVVGPGRGSAAGSLVAYVLSITNIDPLTYDLLFERFLNPERISMPDIDLDFADTRRDEVLGYVERTYGKNHVAHIITFGTMAARVSVRDVGRVLGESYGFCDMLAKLFPPHLTIQEAVERVPELTQLYETEPRAKAIIDHAKKLEGVARHTSMHACGVVITKEPLDEYVPCQYVSPDDKTIIAQYSLHPIEDLGLLKIDFLGLSNLTILENTKKRVLQTHMHEVDYDRLPFDDRATYQLLQEGKTTGVFQLESAGMKRYLKQLRPTEIEDIIAMVSLYRPGPMELIPDYIAGKHHKKTPQFLHPKLKPILEKTYGIAVYQEQLMTIARELANFTLGEADVLRKAIGKKIPKLLKEQKEKFIAGCIRNSISKKIAEQVFDFIEPFAGYGFNRSHGACYAVIAYLTAYMKAHYPAEFMASLLTADHGDSDRIAIDVEECRLLGVEVLPPDINESDASFTVVGSEDGTFRTIRFGLLAIKNVGEHIVNVIVDERDTHGPFSSLENFLRRIQDKDLNKKSLESLIRSGALDRFGDRNQLFYNIDRLLAFHKQSTEQGRANQASLFGGSAYQTHALQLQEAEHIERAVQMRWERELLGLYLTGHPLSDIRDIISLFFTPCSRIRAVARDGQRVKVCGTISQFKKVLTKRNEQMLFAKLEDVGDSLEIIVFPSIYQQYAAVLQEEALVALEGTVSTKDYELKILCNKIVEMNSDFIEKLKIIAKNRVSAVPAGGNGTVRDAIQEDEYTYEDGPERSAFDE